MLSQLPSELIDALQGVEGFDEKKFIEVHEAGVSPVSLRINPVKFSTSDLSQLPAPVEGKVPWTDTGYYLQQRPSFTFDPLFHAGCYYVQEASSMFLEQAIRQLLPAGEAVTALDLCAAPGGKTTHLQSLLPENSLLVSNEVIRTRVPVLGDQVQKWGAANVVVTNQDPSVFARLPEFFDLMVIDAPCSGSGLFRKDADAIEEWSPYNVNLCSQRQRRIVADAMDALKPGGILVYSTCSYSEEEDENISDWIIGQDLFESCSLRIEESWGIVETSSREHHAKGYRFYPDKLKGEGFFIACFRKKGEAEEQRRKGQKLVRVKETELLLPWLKDADSFDFVVDRDTLFAVPQTITERLSQLFSVMHPRYFGIGLGSIMKNRLVPDHSLALSAYIAEVPSVEADRENAVKYLQRQDIQVDAGSKGWCVLRYQNHNLGWINVLPGRINNYYPKELRILKQGPGGFEKL